MDTCILAAVKDTVWCEIILAVVGKDYSEENSLGAGSEVFILETVVLVMVELVGYQG